jgi:hypothetical protein
MTGNHPPSYCISLAPKARAVVDIDRLETDQNRSPGSAGVAFTQSTKALSGAGMWRRLG